MKVCLERKLLFFPTINLDFCMGSYSSRGLGQTVNLLDNNSP